MVLRVSGRKRCGDFERQSALTVIKNVCPLDCPDTCSMLVTVRDGVAVELAGRPRSCLHARVPLPEDGPIPRSGLQPGPVAPPDEAGRTQGRGPIRADHLGRGAGHDRPAVRRRSPARPMVPQAILPYSYCGTMGKLQSSSLDRRFFHRLGASSWTGRSAPRPARLGYEYTMGRGRLGADPMAVPKCKFIVNWGSNTANTNSHLWSLMIEARKAGATIVTVDPYRSPTARRSDWHIQPRPGTDAALALGVMHVIWRDGLQDDDYLDGPPSVPSCSASASLTEYPPEKVAAITGVDVETIDALRPPAGPRAAVADPAQLRHAAAPRRRHGGADDRLPAGDHRLVATSRRRGDALDQRHLRLRHGQAHPPRPLAARARAPST